jgi:hypothetical protein
VTAASEARCPTVSEALDGLTATEATAVRRLQNFALPVTVRALAEFLLCPANSISSGQLTRILRWIPSA